MSLLVDERIARGVRRLVLVALTLLAGAALPGVVFLSTGDPNFNTTAPTGALDGSGWQWVGAWDGFQAAPIGPHHFIAARHIGGAVGDAFVLDGVSYVTTGFSDDPASDLRIWTVSGTFPSWAPLYRSADEVGRGLMVFGRGLIRGAEIRVGGALRGWQWAATDGRLRWGQNTIASVQDGGSYWGQLLYATFDQSGGVNEADLATGDSSGPVFVNDGGGWKLAGVAATVDAYFNTTNSGNGFIAALFDARGLYFSATPPDNWVLIGGPAPVPSGFYATRVSAHLAWIDSVVPPTSTDSDVPAMSAAPLALLGVLLAAVGAGFLRSRNAAEDPA